ncbi:hypothetical protein B0H11DRAFT_1707131, partial [Mycena galericulata]
RRNCGCSLCRRDRNEYGCKNPGQCIEVAKELIDCIQPKWNPRIANNDLCEELELSDAERARNDSGREEEDSSLTFDPLFRLTNLSNGFRIFASEDHTTEFSTKRYMVQCSSITWIRSVTWIILFFKPAC